MQTDSLYRVSLKCVIKNDTGDVLVVKEAGRSVWDFPGGGMEHGETVTQAIARELKEEINLHNSFTYRVIGLTEPRKLVTRDVWQVSVILAVECSQEAFRPGKDADLVAFMPVKSFENSQNEFEQKIYKYATMNV
jgi:ADP-ribose pyrophosphatase YjhB (NUDIX family)